MHVTLAQARELCAQHWNPIGVPMSNVTTAGQLGYRPLPEDEYDTYLVHLLDLLSEGAGDREAKAYLEQVERDYIGLSSPAGDKDEFMRALRVTAQTASASAKPLSGSR